MIGAMLIIPFLVGLKYLESVIAPLVLLCKFKMRQAIEICIFASVPEIFLPLGKFNPN
jgi:hypothetical protein